MSHVDSGAQMYLQMLSATRSCRRPGVATTMATPFLSSAAWSRLGKPPTARQHLLALLSQDFEHDQAGVGLSRSGAAAGRDDGRR